MAPQSIVSILMVTLLFIPVHGELPAFSSDGLSVECSARPGDILLGFLTTFRNEGPNFKERCADTIHWPMSMEFIEAFHYTVDQINSRPDILPNLTLGYVILDTCVTFSPLGALGRAMYYVGDQNNITDYTCHNGVDHFNVAAVVGPTTSSESILAASFLGFFEILLTGFTASSDELSDTTRFPYFLRVNPPDRFQAEAMVDLVSHFNWTYITLLYTQDSYGANGARNVEKVIKQRGQICLAVSKGLDVDSSVEELREIVRTLIKNKNAQVIILFSLPSTTEPLMKVMAEMGVINDFIYVGSDTIPLTSPELTPAGMFGVNFIEGQYPEFEKYYKSLSYSSTSAKQWSSMEIERLYNCQWQPPDADVSCSKYTELPFQNTKVAIYTYLLTDAVWASAYAIDALIKDKCPSASEDKAILDSCLNGPDLLKYALNTTFLGSSGQVAFDKNGDMKGQYSIQQFNNKQWQTVVTWKQSEGLMLLKPEEELFYHITSGARDIDTGIPESVCSKPCKNNEYSVSKDVPCCWECRRCRSHEIPDENATSCVSCPENTWPDEETGSHCEPIPPTFIHWSDPIALGLVALSLLGIICTIFTAVMWIKHKEKKLIKASNREVSGLILVGICLAFLCVIVFIMKPTSGFCVFRQVGFHFSVTLIYVPLLLKINRVYRIFAAGKRGIQKPRFISSRAQMIFIFLLVLSEIVILAGSMIVSPPHLTLQMAIITEKHTELSCVQTKEGFLSPLAFNLIILLFCAVHGLLIRKLPENFNESWYIFVSVLTTLFIWMVFLPTYYSTFYAYYQVALLAFNLILNGFLTLLTLYAPKLYALYFVDEGMLKFEQTVDTLKIQVAPAPTLTPVSRLTNLD